MSRIIFISVPEKLFESREFHPLEFTPFDPNEDHIFFTQTVMVGRAIIVNSMTTLQPFRILQSIPEGSPSDLSLTSL